MRVFFEKHTMPAIAEPEGKFPPLSSRLRCAFSLASSTPLTWAIVLALIFFVISLATIRDYGISQNEPDGMGRGIQALNMAFGLSLQPVAAQSDAPDERHPPFYAICNYLTSECLMRAFGWKPIPAGHFLNILTASAGLVIVFLLGKAMFNSTAGLVAEIFMVFFPRFVAHAQYNAKDVPVMVFSMLSLLFLYSGARGDGKRSWFLGGVTFAIAVTTNLDGLFLLPIFFIPWLISSRFPNLNVSSPRWLDFCMFLYPAVLFIFLFWPALWSNPLQLWSSVVRFSKNWEPGVEVLYLGKTYPVGDVPWHYLPLHLVAVTPVFSVAAIAVGMAVVIQRLFRRQSAFEYGLLCCWLLIPIIARTLPGTINFDGMRHVFFVVPAMAVLAGVGVKSLLDWWDQRQGSKASAAMVGLAIVAWSCWQTVESHPHQGSYLNEAVRCVVPGPKLGKYFDFCGWGTEYKAAVDWLNIHAPPHASIYGDFRSLLNCYSLRSDLHLDDGKSPNFIVIDPPDSTPDSDAKLVYTEQCYGGDLIRIYQFEKKR
jgi:hypothetical protein